jgi:tetratricopeptide (TPR) repeat protein
MNNSDDSTVLLLKYMDGELDAETAADVRNQILLDPDLAARLEQLTLTREAVSAYGLKQQISSLHREIMAEIRQKPVGTVLRFSNNWRNALRVAAGLLVIVSLAVVLQYYQASPEALYDSHFEPFQLASVRGENNTSGLATLYSESKFSGVMQAFQKLAKPGIEDYFLDANAALRLGDPLTAIRSFSRIDELNQARHTHILEQPTAYYLAMAYLDSHQPAKALTLFEKIHRDTDHQYHEQVGYWFLVRVRRLAHG